MVGLLASSCTPLEPPVVPVNGNCKTNADCQSGVCKDNKCINRVDCNLIENISEPFCVGRPCNTKADCPGEFYACIEGLCISGGAGGCVDDEHCVGNEKGEFCLRHSDTEPTLNSCVECLNKDHCPKDQDCSKASYTCISRPPGCKDNAECEGRDATHPLCQTTTGKCIACRNNSDCAAINRPDAVCRQFECVGDDPVDCSALGGSCQNPLLPLCDPAQKICLACNDPSKPDTLNCPEGKMCQADGSCVEPGASLCQSNEQCKNTAEGGILDGTVNDMLTVSAAGVSASANYWCDASDALGDGKKQCKPCRSGAGTNDCGTGFVCNTTGTLMGLCTPTGSTPCPNGPSDCLDGEACVNGACSTNCKTAGGANLCKPPLVCVPTADPAINTCAPAQSCMNGDECQAMLPGFACIGPSASEKTCQPCSDGTNCQDVTGKPLCVAGRCVAQAAVKKALGALCENDTECQSGSCIDFGAADGAACTQVCGRTSSSASTEEDCPLAADPAVVAERGLNASQGFACLNGYTGSNIQGMGLCVTGKDFQAFDSRIAPGNAFKIPGGAAPSGSGLTCQATYATLNVCEYICSTTADCEATMGPGTSCREITVGLLGSTIGVDKRVCRPNDDPVLFQKAPGEFCERANECSENFCDGRVIAELLLLPTPTSCTTNTQCGSGNTCQGNKCYRPTRRTSPATCAKDADCRVGGGTDECWNTHCYDAQARIVPNRACMDSGSVARPGFEFCYGRCGKHCSSNADCASPTALAGTVCNYRPAAPGYDIATSSYQDGIFTGEAWTRVCTAPTPVPPGQEIDHSIEDGGPCAQGADTMCKSEVCVQDLQGWRCANYCGRKDVCNDDQVCYIEDRSVNPTNPNATRLLMPVCRRF